MFISIYSSEVIDYRPLAVPGTSKRLPEKYRLKPVTEAELKDSIVSISFKHRMRCLRLRRQQQPHVNDP
nr:hypothetical protein [Cohnella faecalis]